MGRKKTKNICIVTPAYISCSPRTVKEADALYAAGFNVRVVFSQGNLEEVRKRDETLLKTKPWSRDRVLWSPFRREERRLYYKFKLRLHTAKRLPSFFWRLGKFAEHAEGGLYKELAELAASRKADMYIGHYPLGLAASAYAAFRWKSKLGYDIEDLHTEECPPNDKRKAKRIRMIEKRYIHRCSHLTAVSELVANEIAKRYNVMRPLVIHNTFPWREREAIRNKTKNQRKTALSLYWYSQVIGPDRGIQDAVKAAGCLNGRAEIHLRGYVTSEAKNKFLALAGQHGIEKNLYFHPPALPGELLPLAAEHDVGLALEQPINLSRALSVSNKFFFYLLAGLAIGATDVPGQRYAMSTCPDVGFLYKPGDYRSLAASLNSLLRDPAKLEFCKKASLKAAREKWNWEKESVKLTDAIEKLFKLKT